MASDTGFLRIKYYELPFKYIFYVKKGEGI